MLVYPKIIHAAVSFQTIFIIRCGWSGKIWSSHAGFSEKFAAPHMLCGIQQEHLSRFTALWATQTFRNHCFFSSSLSLVSAEQGNKKISGT